MVRTESLKRNAIKAKNGNGSKRKHNGVSRSQATAFTSRAPAAPRQAFSLHWLSHARYMVWTVLLVLVIPLYFFFNILGKNFPTAIFSKKDAGSVLPAQAGTEAAQAPDDSWHRIGSITFTGGRSQKSVVHGNTVELYRDPQSEWSGVDIEFAQPLDLFAKQLVFFVHGAQGSEALKIAATDVDRKTSHSSEWYTIPLSSERKKITYASEHVKGFLDKHKIARIRMLLQRPHNTDNVSEEPTHVSIETLNAWLK